MTVNREVDMMWRGLVILTVLTGTLFFAGCGAVMQQEKQFRWEPIDENKRELGQVTIERILLEETLASLVLSIPKLSADNEGNIFYLADGDGKLEEIYHSVFPPGCSPYQVHMTNNTDHVIRLNTAVIRLFDPAGNEYVTLMKEDLIAGWAMYGPSTYSLPYVDNGRYYDQIESRLRTIKLIDENTQILPGRTYKGWLVFNPTDLNQPGAWRLSMYEIPVETDGAGKVIRTVHADFNTECQEWLLTYEAENAFAKLQLVSEERVQ